MRPPSSATNGSSGRILVVSRDFFPYASDSAFRVLELCNRLIQLGFNISVLSPARHASWPQQIALGEFPVFRLPPLSSNRLSLRANYRNLRQWIAARRTQFDLLYLDQLYPEAEDLLLRETAHNLPPTIVRFDPRQLSEGFARQIFTSMSDRMTSALCQAQTVLAPSKSAHRLLLSSGLPADRVVSIQDGCHSRVDRSIGSRRQARHTLSESGQELFLKQLDRLLLVPSDLGPHWRIEEFHS